MASGTIKAVVPKSDIVDNLTTNDGTKVLSAAQGYALNGKCKFGKYSSVTLPFEATTDGFLYLWLNPSSVSGAYARVAFTSDNATISGGLNAKAGDGVSLFIPVPKGCYVSQSALSNGSLTARFCPVFE